ncbi:MAG: hypothetical protein J6X60_12740, partial [Ruminiclostridium sp.]|nr:hypothetical protein [Ruminiclostridium sp.]
FMLLDEKVLAEGEGSSFDPIRKSGILWDLVIIDGTGAVDGMNPSLYIDNFGMKTEKLLIFAPYPAEYTTAPDGLKDIVKALLNDDSMAKTIDGLDINEKIMSFTMDTPFADYPMQNSTESTVRIERYAFREDDIPPNLRSDDQSARYNHGGNIFEEYNLPERSIYQKPSYTRSDAETLRTRDKKLAKFLEVIDEVMNSEDQTAIVYFRYEGTVSYIDKILSAIYYDKTGSIMHLDKSLFDVRELKQWYETEPARRVRVVLASDRLSENIGLYTPITHIINYELPDSPVEFQQRLKRKGMFPNIRKPEFIIFMDENGMFDSRVLGKALAGNLYKAFRMNVPSENVLFSIEGIENMIADIISDIKYVSDYTGAVGSSFDIISKFRSDYNVPSARNLTTAARTHEYAQRKLYTLSKALGVSDLVAAKELDRNALISKITGKVNEIRSGYSYFDSNMEIRTIPRKTPMNNEFREFAGYLEGNPFRVGLKTAQEQLKKAVDGKKEYGYLKDSVTLIPDTLKPAVLYNIWIFWHKKLGIGGSYAEFIRAYNEGVI